MTTVSTIEELKAAQEAKIEEIVVVGELAAKLKKAKKVAFLGKVAMGALVATLGAATLTAPVTGGISYLAAAPVTTLTGLEIAAIIAASALGITLVIAIFKDYDEISYENGKMTLKRKS